MGPQQHTIESLPKSRTCTSCKEEKQASEFSITRVKNYGYRLESRCKACRRAAVKSWRVTNPEKAKALYKNRSKKYLESSRAWKRRWQKSPAGKLAARKGTLKMKYGLSLDDYQNMMAAQDGKCAICRMAFELSHVDHCHASGKVRGLLCNGCNSGLGYFRDEPERLRNAISYLKKHQQ